MEEFRVEPCINAGTADSDRKVTLEDDTLRVSILAHLSHLKIEVILYEAPEINVCLVLLAVYCNLLCIILCIAMPL